MTDLSLLAIGIGVVVSALIGGAIGSQRGRAGDGAGLGVLLGPLGWVIALFLPAPTPPSKPVAPRRWWSLGIVGWAFLLLLGFVIVIAVLLSLRR